MSQSEIRGCLRNLIELCNPQLESYFDFDVSEALIDVALEGRLKIIFDNGQLYFQNSDIMTNADKEEEA